MKKLLLPALLGAMFAAGTSAEVRVTVTPVGERAVTPIRERTVSPVRKVVSTADLLVRQDFSDFTTPFIEGPVSTAYISQELLNKPLNSSDGGPVPAEYMGGQEGWRGTNVFSNSGSCVIQTFGIGAEDPCYLDTPYNDYSGTLSISFLAKALPTYGFSYNEDGEEVTSRYTGSSIVVGVFDKNERPIQIVDGNNYSLCDVRLYPDQGWCEIKIEVDNLSAYNDSFLRFSTFETVDIDDIKVTSSADSFIAPPVVKNVTGVTEDSFTINWEPVRKAFNYYVYLYSLEGYDDEGQPILLPVLSPDKKEMAELYGMTVEEFYQMYLEDWDINDPYDFYAYVEGTSFTFSDLDSEKQYCYAVRSHYVSTFSDLVVYEQTVLPTPQTLDATEIGKDCFTAEWKPVSNADYYYVTLCGVETATEANDEYYILEDGFDKSGDLAQASIDSPEEIAPEAINDYTDMPGWTVIGIPLVADGHIGVRYYYGGIISPELYLKGADTVTVHAVIESNSPNSYAFYLASSATTEWVLCEFVDGRWEGDVTFETGGAEWGNIQVIDIDGSDIFIDYMAVTRNVNKGDRIYTYQDAAYAMNTTSMRFEDLNTDMFSTFGYNVIAVQDTGEAQPRTSARSRMQIVDLANGSTAVDNMAGASKDVEITDIYTVSGEKVSQPVKGINIIRYSDGSTKKITVR
ncbi:MAG: hypothetical protein K2H86_05455 [Muribaculaceae bacterium]|nr:hypothetical protein [Muribaculaceae bacterium]